MRHIRKSAAFLVMAVALLVAACAPAGGGSAQIDQSLEGTKWQLESLGPVGSEAPTVDGSNATLEFDTGGRVGGLASCNNFGGSYTVEGDKITFGDLTQTLMLCADEVNGQETAFLGALQAAGRYEVSAHGLTIWYDEGGSALHFRPAA